MPVAKTSRVCCVVRVACRLNSYRPGAPKASRRIMGLGPDEAALRPRATVDTTIRSRKGARNRKRNKNVRAVDDNWSESWNQVRDDGRMEIGGRFASFCISASSRFRLAADVMRADRNLGKPIILYEAVLPRRRPRKMVVAESNVRSCTMSCTCTFTSNVWYWLGRMWWFTYIRCTYAMTINFNFFVTNIITVYYNFTRIKSFLTIIH